MDDDARTAFSSQGVDHQQQRQMLFTAISPSAQSSLASVISSLMEMKKEDRVADAVLATSSVAVSNQQRKRPSHLNQQSTIKLEELLSELNQLDLAVNEGTLTNDMAHMRALLVQEIHRVHALLPSTLKRRYSPQMPSTMKRVVCVSVNKPILPINRGFLSTGSLVNLKSVVGGQISKLGSSGGRQRHGQRITGKSSNYNGISATSSVGGSGRGNPLQRGRLHQQLCASIPSLLSTPRASFYADHGQGICTGYDSSTCSLVKCAVASADSGLRESAPYDHHPFVNTENYLYRCDFAQHVQYENGHFTMQQRIYLPENPTFKIIGRILGPRGNSLRQLESETGCRIVIRGKGSVKDPQKEARLNGLPGWEHLAEPLHVLITAQHQDQFLCSRQLHYAVHCVNSLMSPRFDAYKREQLLQLAIINGTYQPRP